MATDHVDQLFSAAVDDDLSPRQDTAFHAHLSSCDTCAASFAAFRESVDGVRRLPHAAMPLPVHLPSGAPVAERATAAAWLRKLIPRTLPFGAASGVAAVAALAIVVLALSRGGAPASTGSASPNATSQRAIAGAAPLSPASCPTAGTSALAPYGYRVSAGDPSRPGQELTLAASDQSVAAGSTIQLSAVLTAPAPEVAAPGASASAASISVAPCLTLTGISSSIVTAPSSAFNPNAVAPAPQQLGSRASAAVPGAELTIPPGTPPGTVFHVIATIPADYPGTNQAPLSVALAITVR
ncbi:MAG: anti-sigma factor family protein [Candidatus Dormibacteria bacterium]